MTESVSKLRHYDVIDTPVITEKATVLTSLGQYVFFVKKDATKPQIKAAIEALFEVKVKAVNTMIQKGKKKTFRGRVGQLSDKKKAIVTLQEGQTIDLSHKL